MKRTALAFVISAALFANIVPSVAAERTVTLGVKMGCPICPYIVKQSLAKVAGVLDVSVSYGDQIAIVRFDDQRTSVATLSQATADVGFPSKPLSKEKTRGDPGRSR